MKKARGKKLKATVRVYEWLWKAVQHHAIEEGVSAEAIVTQALIEYLGIKPGDFEVKVSFERPRKGRKKGGN